MAAATPRPVAAQHVGPAKIGWLTTGPHPGLEDFRRGLRDLGWVEGQNVVIEQRYAGDAIGRLDELAAELGQRRVDVVLVSGAAATTAAKRLLSTVPVVAVAGDLVALGAAASLARPGGNITGLAILATDLASKWVELLTLAVPGLSRIAILADPGGQSEQLPAAEAAAARLGLQTTSRHARNSAEIEAVFRTARQERAGGAAVMSSPLFASLRRRIVDLAAHYRVPTIYEHRAFVEVGGLMSYGPDLRLVFRRAAWYVDRILKGTKPADLPIERPTRFEVVVNLRAAKSLGLTLPPSFLIRADEVLP